MFRPIARTNLKQFTTLALAGATFVLTACGDPAATAPALPARDNASAAPGQIDPNANAAVNRDLAQLRSAMARFHDYEYASTVGEYNILFMDMCMVDESPAQAGGMGLHYIKGSLVDDKVSVTEPEALLYEPGPDGKKVLVAVEYAIPADLWTSAQPPRLFGRDFTLNSFNLWALHVWAWKDNPSANGIFASWNPRVSCQYWNNGHSGGHN